MIRTTVLPLNFKSWWWCNGTIARLWPKGSKFESGRATIDFSPKVNLHSVFFSSYKNSMLTFQSSSQAPRQSFRVQTAVLLPTTSSPCLTLANSARCFPWLPLPSSIKNWSKLDVFNPRSTYPHIQLSFLSVNEERWFCLLFTYIYSILIKITNISNSKSKWGIYFRRQTLLLTAKLQTTLDIQKWQLWAKDHFIPWTQTMEQLM